MCRKNIEGARKYDMFGAEVGLTFEEKENYQTKCGGWSTILIFVLLIGNLSQEVYKFITSKSYTKVVNKTYNEYASAIN